MYRIIFILTDHLSYDAFILAASDNLQEKTWFSVPCIMSDCLPSLFNEILKYDELSTGTLYTAIFSMKEVANNDQDEYCQDLQDLTLETTEYIVDNIVSINPTTVKELIEEELLDG